MDNSDLEKSTAPAAGCTYLAIFSTLTAKQHDVFALLADGRTAKEIAWRLGITDSAVVQRIEAVRSRAGSPLRVELARDYRAYLASHPSIPSSVPATPSAQPASASSAMPAGRRPMLSPEASAAVAFAESELSDGHAWPPRSSGLIVPEMFAGPNAGLNRTAAMVVIAAGLLAIAMLSLGVVQALANLL